MDRSSQTEPRRDSRHPPGRHHGEEDCSSQIDSTTGLHTRMESSTGIQAAKSICHQHWTRAPVFPLQMPGYYQRRTSRSVAVRGRLPSHPSACNQVVIETMTTKVVMKSLLYFRLQYNFCCHGFNYNLIAQNMLLIYCPYPLQCAAPRGAQ